MESPLLLLLLLLSLVFRKITLTPLPLPHFLFPCKYQLKLKKNSGSIQDREKREEGNRASPSSLGNPNPSFFVLHSSLQCEILSTMRCARMFDFLLFVIVVFFFFFFFFQSNNIRVIDFGSLKTNNIHFLFL